MASTRERLAAWRKECESAIPWNVAMGGQPYHITPADEIEWLCGQLDKLAELRIAVQAMVEDGHPDAEDWFAIMERHLKATEDG